MKIFLMMMVAVSFQFGDSALAGSCSQEQRDRGCHEEQYECDRPTHYTCTSCTCPKAENEISETESIELALERPEFKTITVEFPESNSVTELSCCGPGLRCCGQCCR